MKCTRKFEAVSLLWSKLFGENFKTAIYPFGNGDPVVNLIWASANLFLGPGTSCDPMKWLEHAIEYLKSGRPASLTYEKPLEELLPYIVAARLAPAEPDHKQYSNYA